MTNKVLTAIAYLLLLSVVVPTFRSVYIGFADEARYLAYYPDAVGALYWITMCVSFLAGLNCIVIGLRQRWAIFVNPLIGLGSIVLIYIVGGPASNAIVVLVACTLTTLLPWYLWGRQPMAESADQ